MKFDKIVILCAYLCLFSYEELNDPIVKDAYSQLGMDINLTRKIDIDNTSTTISVMKNQNIAYISWRGTDEIADWIYNFDVSAKSQMIQGISIGKVHNGMWNYYKSVSIELIKIIQELIKTKTERIIFTGYSLGCSVVFSAIETQILFNRMNEKVKIHCYLFASPKIGDKIFMETLNIIVPRYMHIALQSDLVPSFPFFTSLIKYPKTYIVTDSKTPIKCLRCIGNILRLFLFKKAAPNFITSHYLTNYIQYLEKFYIKNITI